MKTRSGRKSKDDPVARRRAGKQKPDLQTPPPRAERRRLEKKSGRETSAFAAPLRLALVPPLILAALSLLPRVGANPWLRSSFWGAALALVLMQAVLWQQVRRTGRTLTCQVVPLPVHWVQASMQACIYAYWGSYWPEVYRHVPLIVAQIVLVYGLDMLVSWFRRDQWVLGFGPFPIVLSTNLFMWFKDDWFFLQFLMVATGVLGKEFIKWTRDGRRTHIFNPSALSLFLFSVGLIVTHSTDITWGPEIAATIGLPPRMYLWIFLVGLVVQGLFSVTLVTLSAAATLFALNLVYTGSTGIYHFIITNIPVAVFLGLHLLVTDPATSPRRPFGKVLFGAAYGVSAFALFGLLGRVGIPTFYDKLLCVPVLNLTVRVLDRISDALAARFRVPMVFPEWSPRASNLAAMAVWASLFVTMSASGFLGRDHPGRDAEFWRRACSEGRRSGCETWVMFLEASCQAADGESCKMLGDLKRDGRVVPANRLEAGKSFGRACDVGLAEGCDELKRFADADGRAVFEKSCAGGDSYSCFVLGEVHAHGLGVSQDRHAAIEFFERSCAGGWPRGCGRLGEVYLLGEGTPTDVGKAVENFEKACRGGHAASCSAVAMVYRRGIGGLGNETLADERQRQACRLGLSAACSPGDAPASAGAVAPIDVLRLGG
ncbi:MAG: hypothetical protein QOD06_82 [Candidatus Binatota bacterium]|nr:hypothetical protein [Candidatus Binatota bacterium]